MMMKYVLHLVIITLVTKIVHTTKSRPKVICHYAFQLHLLIIRCGTHNEFIAHLIVFHLHKCIIQHTIDCCIHLATTIMDF